MDRRDLPSLSSVLYATAGTAFLGYMLHESVQFPDDVTKWHAPDQREYDHVLDESVARARIVAYLKKEGDFQASCKKRGKKVDMEAEVWADAILQAIDGAYALPQEELIRAVLALLKKESSFNPNPDVWNLKNEFKSKLDKLKESFKGLPEFLDISGRVEAAKQKYGDRIISAPNEAAVQKILDEIREEYRLDLLSYTPLVGDLAERTSRKLDQKTRGAMQVNVMVAEKYFRDKCATERGKSDPVCKDLDTDGFEAKLWWIRPNIEVGIHLIDAGMQAYGAEEAGLRFTFAGYNAGPYAPRNAAFQNMINKLVDDPAQTLVLDGDLLAFDPEGHPSPQTSQTENVLHDLCQREPRLFGACKNEYELRADLLHSQYHDWVNTDTFIAVRRLYWDKVSGSRWVDAPYALMPVGANSTRETFSGTAETYANSALRFYQQVRF